MATVDQDNPPAAASPLDPGPAIRAWAAMLLRLAIGVSLTRVGLASYFRLRQQNQPLGLAMNDADRQVVSVLSSCEIAIGLAMILGFLVAAASVAVAILLLAIPIVQTFQEMTWGGVTAGLADPYMVSQFLPILILPPLLLLWLSDVRNHPWSIDALIFARRASAAAIRPPVPPG